MKVHKIGNSLMVAIPHQTARRLNIHEGDDVEVVERGAEVVIQPGDRQPELTFIGSIDVDEQLGAREYEPDPWR